MKIFAVGRNYAQHNKAGNPALYKTEPPVIFTKVDSSLLTHGKPFFVPDHLGRIVYGAGVVVRIGRLGKSIPERFAHRYYDAVTVGLDFTACDLLQEARQKGQPWTICKDFDGAATIGEWLTVDDVTTRCPAETRGEWRLGDGLHFRLDRNGETVQQGCTADLLYSADRLIAHVSRYCTLKTGDLLYTGTPDDTIPVSVGDRLEGWIEDEKVLEVRCK